MIEPVSPAQTKSPVSTSGGHASIIDDITAALALSQVQLRSAETSVAFQQAAAAKLRAVQAAVMLQADAAEQLLAENATLKESNTNLSQETLDLKKEIAELQRRVQNAEGGQTSTTGPQSTISAGASPNDAAHSATRPPVQGRRKEDLEESIEQLWGVVRRIGSAASRLKEVYEDFPVLRDPYRADSRSLRVACIHLNLNISRLQSVQAKCGR